MLFLALAGGFLCLWQGSRSIAQSPEAPDIPASLSLVLLTGILVMGVLMRLHGIGSPVGDYFDDHAFDAIDTRNMMDLKDYHMIFPIQYQNPLYNYWLFSIWSFMPETNGLVMQRIAATSMETVTLWLLYLLGREMTGHRRAGLILAFLGAVSKPFLREVVHGMLVVTTPLAFAVGLLFLLRFMKKPGWKYALLYGFSLALMMYSYIALRPAVPFAALILPIWILWNRPHRAPLPVWLLAAAGGAIWLLLFSWRGGALAAKGFWGLLLHPVAWGIYVLILIALVGRVRQEVREGRDDGRILFWLGGLAFGTLLMAPLIFHIRFPQRMAMLIVFTRDAENAGITQPVRYILQNLAETFRAYFVGKGFFYDGILGYHAVLLSAIGFVFLLSRPSVPVWLVALSIPSSALGYIISYSNHHARAIPAVLPILVLCAVGLDRIASSWKRPFHAVVGGLLMLSFLAWHAVSDFTITTRWAQRPGIARVMADLVRADSPSRRVYTVTAPQFDSPLSQGVISEGRPLRVMLPDNPIGLEENEPVPDVVVLFSGTNDPTTYEKLKTQFPGAEFSEYRTPATQDPRYPLVRRMLLKSDQVPLKPGKLFHVVRRKPGEWIRQRSYSVYGLNRGTIGYEDVTASWSAPMSYDGRATLRYQGNLKAPQSGDYRFTSKTHQFVVLDVDGKRVLDERPTKGVAEGTGQMRLEAGDHRVVLQTYCNLSFDLPQVFVEGPGLPKTPLEIAGR